MIIAKKNAAYYLSFPAIDATTPESYNSGISPVDTAYSKDGTGAWTTLALTDTASEIGSTGVYEIDLSATEMNHDKVIIKFAVSGMADDAYQFDLRTKLTDDLQDITAANVNTECDIAITDAALATAANLATVDTNVDAVLVDTGTTLPASIATIDGNVDTILVDTNDLQANQGNWITATGFNVVVPDAAGVAPTALENADALLNRDMSAVSDTTARSPLNALRLLRNKWSVAGTTMTVTKEDDSTSAWTAVVSTDAAADPVIGSDPA